jgi:DNA-binding transcriptional MerR regulator
MLASEAARKLGVAPRTLIDYEAAGVFTVRRDQCGRRVYTEVDLAAIRAHMERRAMHRQKALSCST